MSTGTRLLSAGVGVRLGEASSLSIAVGVQSARVWVMCGSTVLFEDRVFSSLDTGITRSNSNG